MKKKAVQELTLKNFQRYGRFANMLNPQTDKIGDAPIEFFRDMAPLSLGTSASASFSICRVEKRTPVVDVTEYHNNCEEGILPLDGDILIHVSSATPGKLDTEDIEIFRVPQGTFVSIRPGVWHHAPYAHNCDYANVVIVLPERTYVTDCFVYELTEEEQVEIES